ncbi:hypothetical protein [Frankia sp. AiPa1]|uniref:hypothetical protein n=1 Tax=Frankia sp. AiPa1 TaxID=573492 RepID=UPI00202AD455|nr:hypothetical protein [Frankia sp. AiPa1]
MPVGPVGLVFEPQVAAGVGARSAPPAGWAWPPRRVSGQGGGFCSHAGSAPCRVAADDADGQRGLPHSRASEPAATDSLAPGFADGSAVVQCGVEQGVLTAVTATAPPAGAGVGGQGGGGGAHPLTPFRLAPFPLTRPPPPRPPSTAGERGAAATSGQVVGPVDGQVRASSLRMSSAGQVTEPPGEQVLVTPTAGGHTGPVVAVGPGELDDGVGVPVAVPGPGAVVTGPALTLGLGLGLDDVVPGGLVVPVPPPPVLGEPPEVEPPVVDPPGVEPPAVEPPDPGGVPLPAVEPPAADGPLAAAAALPVEAPAAAPLDPAAAPLDPVVPVVAVEVEVESAAALTGAPAPGGVPMPEATPAPTHSNNTLTKTAAITPRDDLGELGVDGPATRRPVIERPPGCDRQHDNGRTVPAATNLVMRA